MSLRYYKPLFHEKTLARAVRNYAFPADLDARQAVIQKWIETINSRTLEDVKEVSLHGEFLRDIFGTVLGYASVIQGEGKTWTLHAEATISDGGGSADGALGFFTAKETLRGGVKLAGRVIAPIELKGVRNDLDRPAPGRNESAVDQGWRYVNYTPNCQWLIVSNYRELRLYRTSKTPAYYERFLLTDLADAETFRRFYFLLCAGNFLPVGEGPEAQSRIVLLLKESDGAEAAITRDLYAEYKETRLALVEHLQRRGPKDVDAAVLIEKAQKLLDRVLFVAFCEDRGLLPKDTFKRAHDDKNLYNPTPIWTRYKAVFRWVDAGRDDPPIPGYNGGLFKLDPILDEQIDIPDALCTRLNQLTRYDFDTDVSVEVLGHIFEQSVTDLEELKAISAGREFDKKKGTRKTTGVYYTPAFITQYIVDLALGGYLRRKEEELRERFNLASIPETQKKKRREKEILFWEAYRDEVLKRTRVLDPACGSGAFLIAAFDHLLAQYERANAALAALQGGQSSLFDLNKTILTNNLFGVDLSKESVEITKLSLWLKTAERGKALTFLDDNIQQGNSIVDDSALDPAAFDWRGRFKQVFADGGFDVVIGNPPYVRQELLSPYKPYLQEHYKSFDGVADLYTYFYERGFQVLKEGGALSYIVTNKWLKSGYGEALRRFFAESTVFEQILDFGHAPIFEDADTFPCIVLVRKPANKQDKGLKPLASTMVCPVPREKLPGINLSQYVAQNGYAVPWSRFGEAAWSLEHPAVDALMEKLRRVGVPLAEYADVKPYYGIKTGCNEAFLIDTPTRDRLVREDPNCAEIVKPFLRGQDIKRWSPEWAELWIVLMKSSGDHKWPWSGKEEAEAEHIFSKALPSLHAHFKLMEAPLHKRQDQGRYWWELRSCAYYDIFDKPKLVHTDITWRPQFAYAPDSVCLLNTAYVWPISDFYLLAVINSPLLWAYMWRNAMHGKDEALRLIYSFVETIPIAPPTPAIRTEAEKLVPRLIEITKANQGATHEVLAWLKAEMHIDSPGNALSDFAALDADAFIAEAKKRIPKAAGGLGPKQVKALHDVYRDYALPIQTRDAEAARHEARLSDLVNLAYGLTPEEIDLMWKTAPPRMPGTGKAKNEH